MDSTGRLRYGSPTRIHRLHTACFMLSRLWFGFFAIAFLSAGYQWLFLDQPGIFASLIRSTFEMAKLSVEIAIGLIGVLALWLGFFNIAEQSGMIGFLSRRLSPLFRVLMPEVPANHPAHGSITMNIAANLLGLDNAATPMGLKAMQDLQGLNPEPDTASNAQILFLVINASSVTLLPVTIFMYRAQMGAAQPTAVFIPILLATSASTLTGLLAVAYMQRINLFNKTVLLYFGFFSVLLAALASVLIAQPAEAVAESAGLLGNLTLMTVIMLFLTAGMVRKVDVYDAFVDGARQGFDIAIRLIPYLLAMLVAIGLLRQSGALDMLVSLITRLVEAAGIDSDFVPALTTALMKPLSGSGSRAMMLETMNTYGVDSFPATLSAIMQGSTETTFYVLAVYFGSVGVRHVRHALGCALLADFVGIVVAILAGYWFFH